ncbi:hypothetical protein M9H77_01977 [Catharanthus roseus]|uniref:Uncharacterized protein n=1 Tax=Catharanthus roseus TaxID=4058 RepID=A0ACC0C721_CATRO|nr:hypothetical protein M9H77_01977 [Catharanthus roseus]
MVATEQSSVNGWKAMWNFSHHLLKGRWFMVFACFLILSMSGATYMFGLYSGDIKESLGYDQTTLNLLSFFKDLGANVGIISGLFNEIAPPWLVLLLGSSMNFVGYFMVWLAVTGKIGQPPLWQMCLYICIGANSQTFANTVVLVTGVQNFPESRGVVIGLLKGFVGLSGAIITQLYHAMYGHNSKSLILLIGWLPAAVSVVFLRTIRTVKLVRQSKELQIFYKFLYIALGLAGFLMIIIILQNRLVFTSSEYAGSASFVLILLFAPILVIIKEEFNLWKKKRRAQLKISSENQAQIEEELKIPENHQEQKEEVEEEKRVSCFSNIFRPPKRGEDYTILQALFSIDMIILFTTTTFGVGGTLTAIDNLGQIGKALGYPTKSISTFVSLVSIWNFLGRVTSGFASEILLSKYKVPRPLMLSLVLILSCVGHLLIAFGNIPNSLYIASLITGFCFGAQWPLIFSVISELFGLKYYSTLINLGAGASPVGNYILNVKLAGHLYDKEALKQMKAKGLTRKEGEDLSCNGVDCYKISFLIITGATLLGCFASVLLLFRTRKFYKGDIYRKFKEQAEVVDPETTTAMDKDSGHLRPPPPPPPPVPLRV